MGLVQYKHMHRKHSADTNLSLMITPGTTCAVHAMCTYKAFLDLHK